MQRHPEGMVTWAAVDTFQRGIWGLLALDPAVTVLVLVPRPGWALLLFPHLGPAS